MRLFQRFYLTGDDLGALESQQVPVGSSKYLAVDDGFDCLVYGLFIEARFRVADAVRYGLAFRVNQYQTKRPGFFFSHFFLLSAGRTAIGRGAYMLVFCKNSRFDEPAVYMYIHNDNVGLKCRVASHPCEGVGGPLAVVGFFHHLSPGI